MKTTPDNRQIPAKKKQAYLSLSDVSGYAKGRKNILQNAKNVDQYFGAGLTSGPLLRRMVRDREHFYATERPTLLPRKKVEERSENPADHSDGKVRVYMKPDPPHKEIPKTLDERSA